MKKISLFLLIFTLFFTIFGCSSEKELKKISKNLTSYELNLDYDDSVKQLFGEEIINYVNSQDVVLKDVKLHLYPNAFRSDAKYKPTSLSSENKAYPNGKNFGNILIENISVDNQHRDIKIEGSDEDILHIDFQKEVYPEDSIKITIKFSVVIPNINHRFGYGENCVNLANFYPIACVYENGQFNTSPYSSNGDPFYSDMANYKINFKCDDDFVVASTGKQESISEEGGKKILELSAVAVRDFALVLSKKFEVVKKNVDGVDVRYYYYDDVQPNQSLQTACDSLVTFNSEFGKYPYSTLSVVRTNFVHGGMEYPNLVYISDDLQNYADYTNVIIHEIAHQWWYNLVGNNACVNSWVDEGLTEWSTALFYEKNPKYGVDYSSIMTNALANYNLFVEVYSSVYGDVDTTMNRSLYEFKTEPEYVYITYVKGMLLFDSLREIVGERAFRRALKDYFNENKFKISSPETLISSFEKSTGKDLESFFDSWINGKIVLIRN